MHAWLCSMTLQSHAWLCQAMHGFAWLCKAMREFQSRMAFDGPAAAGLGPACALARLRFLTLTPTSSWSESEHRALGPGRYRLSGFKLVLTNSIYVTVEFECQIQECQ